MKKILATILALAMVLSLSVSAMAEDKTEDIDIGGESVGTVEVAVVDITDTVYSVTVDWKDTSLQYYKNDGEWNPETHSYEGTENFEEYEQPRWISSSATVTVTNHSNAAVTATIDDRDITTGTTYSFDKESFDLVTAEGTQVNDAPNNTFTITAETAPDVAGNDTFVVTISQYVEEPEYTYESIGASDSYWEDEVYIPEITTNTLTSFYMSNYVYEMDGVTDNDAYINYEVTSVVCTNAPEKMVSEGEYVRFTEAGEYEVTVTFHDGYANADTTKTLTLTVTE